MTFTPLSFSPDGFNNQISCANVSVNIGDGAVEDDEVFLLNLTTADPSRIAIAQSIYEVTIIDSTGTAYTADMANVLDPFNAELALASMLKTLPESFLPFVLQL